MKNIKKVSAAAMSVMLMGYLAVPVFAEAEPSEKEEVIYIMTDAFGNVTDMEAVNVFSGGDITDYGDYSAVKILNTTDRITQEGDQITFSSGSDKVYYQGTMKNTAIPWNIYIRYFMDGEEYSAEDIAGKSSALKIHFTVTKNENCKGSFYEDYALQASFTFDTDIVGSGATIANVGSDKQLTYTIPPDKGIDTVIKADVTDFEMDSAAINGVRLNMNINVDDSELTDKVKELVSAVADLNDGASEVRGGTGELYYATGTPVETGYLRSQMPILRCFYYLFLKLPWAAPVSLLKSLGKIAVVVKAAKAADGVYGVGGVLYHVSRISQTVIFQILKRGLTRYVPEAPEHLAFADECGGCHVIKSDLFSVMVVDKKQYVTEPCLLGNAGGRVRRHILFRQMDKYPEKLGKLVADDKLVIGHSDIFRVPDVCEQPQYL